MKKFYFLLSGLILLCVPNIVTAQCVTINCISDTILPSDSSICGAVFNYNVQVNSVCFNDTVNFSYTGNPQSWVVPAGVTMIHVELLGAAGGGNAVGPAGLGGRLTANIPVTPGQTLEIYVGGIGDVSGTAGYNGGGSGLGGSPSNPGSGGGGATDIRIGGITLNDRVLVAGGGGGGTENGGSSTGGNGGGLTGADGGCGGNPWGCTPLNLATGGTQLTGGLGGTSVSCAWNGFNGSFGQGGNSHNNYRSAGGGGGWYGGGGAHNGCAGAGGSSYAHPTATLVAHTQGYNPGDGMVRIAYNSIPYSTTLIAGLPSGSTFPVGTTTNTISVIDSIGNADTCSFTVTIVDQEPPTIIVPADIASCSFITTSLAPMVNDNCAGITVTYYTTGATITSGTGDITGTPFGIGTTTVWYVVQDAQGNLDSASFDVTIYPTPVVSLSPFSNNSVCITGGTVPLPSASPAGGSYSGTGVVGSNFDPSVSGTGNFWITYTYTSVDGCIDSDSTMISVYPLPVVSLSSFSNDTVCVNGGTIPLPLGSPAAGSYSGAGVVGSNFDPSVSGTGDFWITYTSVSGDGCVNSDSTMISVIGCSGLESWSEGFKIYPNPSTGILTVEIDEASVLFITNTLGEMILTRTLPGGNAMIDLSAVSSGVYYVSLQTPKKILRSSIMIVR